jgi:hypothetical protein
MSTVNVGLLLSIIFNLPGNDVIHACWYDFGKNTGSTNLFVDEWKTILGSIQYVIPTNGAAFVRHKKSSLGFKN